MATVLIVDDEKLVAQMMRMFLQRDGHEVLTAQTGKEACKIAQERAKGIDLSIVDETLPDGDGADVVQRLLRSHPGMKVLRISGRPWEQAEKEKSPPGSAFLQKPFNSADLVGEVRRILGREDGRSSGSGSRR